MGEGVGRTEVPRVASVGHVASHAVTLAQMAHMEVMRLREAHANSSKRASGLQVRPSRLGFACARHPAALRRANGHCMPLAHGDGQPQTALEMAKADLESAAAAASEEAARRSDAEGRLMSLQGQVTNLRSTVEQELEAALRESTHRSELPRGAWAHCNACGLLMLTRATSRVSGTGRR